MALFRKRKPIRISKEHATPSENAYYRVDDKLVERCPACKNLIIQKESDKALTCPNCDFHFRMGAKERIDFLINGQSFQEMDPSLVTQNVDDFPGYDEKLIQAKQRSNLKEAVVTGKGLIKGQECYLGVMDANFMMASMGRVVGEKITRLFEAALVDRRPVVLFIASGGARMQEGIFSLMQMAKVSQAVSAFQQAGLLYISVLTHPTTGGVSASFAMQADIILAEPKATIGFAGKRVIQQTIRSELPEDFQLAETVLENGYIDRIVPRGEQAELLSQLLYVHTL